jgi:hypothetical protein
LERAFYREGHGAARPWWNGKWGQLARRDIWLKRDQVWRVEARQGDGDSRVWSHEYPTEAEARAAVAEVMDRTGGPGEWKDLTRLSAQDNHP